VTATPTSVTTRTLRFWLDDEGFLRGECFEDVESTLEDAREALRAQEVIAAGVRRPVLMDISKIRSISREARQLLASPAASAWSTRLALVVASPLSRAIGNFFLGLNRLVIPTRLFSTPEDALAWLRRTSGEP